MKTGKLIILLALWLVRQAHAQEFKAKLTGDAKKSKVVLVIENGAVKVEGYDGNEVSIQALSEPTPDHEKRSDGLTPLQHPKTPDNTKIGLAVTQEAYGLLITKVVDDKRSYLLKVPRQVAIAYQETGVEQGQIEIDGVNGAIEVSSTVSDIDLRNVRGPVTASSDAGGNITAVFTDADQLKNSSLSSVGGSVDITMLPSAKVSFKLKPVAGKVYTDFDIAVKNGESRNGKRIATLPNDITTDNEYTFDPNNPTRWADDGQRIAGTINGGGPEMELLGTDIFIRKKK